MGPPSTTVLGGRVARRIWAVAMREKTSYVGMSRQTELSRANHVAQPARSDIAFNRHPDDVAVALLAVYETALAAPDAYRRGHHYPYRGNLCAAPWRSTLISNVEWGLAESRTPISAPSSQSTELTGSRSRKPCSRISRRSAERGGVLGAMDTDIPARQIQEESMQLRDLKQNGEYPIIGVQHLPKPARDSVSEAHRTRGSTRCRSIVSHATARLPRAACSLVGTMLKRLQQSSIDNSNVFQVLMAAVRVCSLGHIITALFECADNNREACEGNPCPATSSAIMRRRLRAG